MKCPHCNKEFDPEPATREATGDFQIAVRPLDKQTAERLRTDITRRLLQEIINGLKQRIDWISWINAGWIELEDVVVSLCNGGYHPALLAWEADKKLGGHPGPSVRELYARRVVVLMCKSLERTGLGVEKAREFAARKLRQAQVFAEPPSERTIRYWVGLQPKMSPREELLVAGGFAASGGDPERLVYYFLALAHLAMNPSVVVTDKNPRDYFGNLSPT
jgi:hypothetical protein